MSRWQAVTAACLMFSGCLGGPDLVQQGVPLGEVEPSVQVQAGSARKICQLTGDLDRERNEPTLSRSFERYRLLATDLGASVLHGGQTVFLFGDVWDSELAGVSSNSDAVGFTTEMDPERCLRINFHERAPGRFLPLQIPGVSSGGFEVPTGGFSVGESLYVFVTTDHTARNVMGRSVLARSRDGGRNFQAVYDVSTTKFINVAPVAHGEEVYFWASGRYRESDPVLARVPRSDIEQKAAWRYFAGVDAETREPLWSAREGDAQALFHQACVGELSVGWNEFLARWVMLYGCDTPRGINVRFAENPWGPWSRPQVVFEPWRDGGYCEFMHVSQRWQAERGVSACDRVSDPGRENEWGGEYGAYLISHFTRGTRGERSTIYFTLSTWNPYAVVLMRAELLRAP